MQRPRFEIDQLGLDPRACNILVRMGITTRKELYGLTKSRFMSEWRAGPRFWEQIEPFTAKDQSMEGF